MPDIDKLLSAIDSYADQSYGSEGDGGELSRQRSLALDAFQAKNIEPAPEGRSQVVDWSVFETIMWIMPSLMRIFASGSDIVEFEPTGEEDEESAEQESIVLNHMVQNNDWELTARTWMQDALTTKNAYCMTSMEEKIIPEVETYEGQSEEQVAMLLEDDVEVVGHDQYNDPDDEGTLIHPSGVPVQDEAMALDALMQYEAAGVEPQLQYRQLHDIKVRKTKPVKRLKYQVLPAEHCRIAKNTPDFTLEGCDYFEFWDDVSISYLRSLGYDVEDDIASDEEDTREDEARDNLLGIDTDFDTTDPSMREVRARWIWIRTDYDEDGIAELNHVVMVGREVISRDGEDPVQMVSNIPVASIVPFINTHRHIGISVADAVFDIQRIKTALLRSALDSLYLATNPRHAISDKVSIDDMLVSRPGSLVRLKGGAVPGDGHVMPLPTENTFPYAQQGLLHMDTVTESRVGVNRMFQGIDSSNINDHNRIGQLSTMAAQRVEDIARIFAAGFKRLFALSHELLIKSGHQGQSIKLRGQWVDIDPSQWRTGRDMRIVAPFAAGNKDSLVQRLMVHMQVHREALAAGAPFVQVDDTYELARLLAEATDVPGDKIYTDPASVPPKEPGPDYTLEALKIEKQKADNSAMDSQIDAQVKTKEIETDAALKQYQIDKNSELQIALAQLKEGQQINLETVRASLKEVPLNMGDAFNETKGIQAELQAMMDQINQASADLKRMQTAPVKIVRDAKGNITGKEVDGQFVPVQVNG